MILCTFYTKKKAIFRYFCKEYQCTPIKLVNKLCGVRGNNIYEAHRIIKGIILNIFLEKNEELPGCTGFFQKNLYWNFFSATLIHLILLPEFLYGKHWHPWRYYFIVERNQPFLFNEIVVQNNALSILLMAGNLTSVLAYGFVYCQRHHHRPGIVLEVTSSIVEDYTYLVPASLPFLQTLASHSPLMACQLMIALISLYPVITIGKQQGKLQSS